MGRRARTEEAKQARRELILEAARDSFFKLGYEATTIERIMEAAGLSTGTFYLYFKSKIEIYKILLDHGIDILEQMLSRAVSHPSASASERILLATDAYLAFYEQHPEYFDIIAVISVRADELRERESSISQTIDEKNLRILKQVGLIIEQGVHSGEFRSLDPWLAATGLWGLMDGLIMLADRNNLRTVGIELKALVKHSLGLTLDGMRTKN